MSLEHFASINSQGDIAGVDPLVLTELLCLVQGIEHLLPSVVHDLLVADAAKTELEDVGSLAFSAQDVVALVVVEERFLSEVVPVKARLRSFRVLLT